MNHDLLMYDWSNLHNLTVDEGYSLILDKINSVADQYALYHERWIAPNNIINEPWMSKAMLKSSKKKTKIVPKEYRLWQR